MMVVVWIANYFDAAAAIVVVSNVRCSDVVAEKAEAGVLVKAVLVFAVGSVVAGLLVGWVAVAFGVVAVAATVVDAEFAAAMAELQAEVMVEMGVVKKVAVSAEIDSGEEMAVTRIVVYVGSVAAEVVVAVGLLESYIVAVVEELAQAAVTVEIGVAAKDAGTAVDVVV